MRPEIKIRGWYSILVGKKWREIRRNTMCCNGGQIGSAKIKQVTLNCSTGYLPAHNVDSTISPCHLLLGYCLP